MASPYLQTQRYGSLGVMAILGNGLRVVSEMFVRLSRILLIIAGPAHFDKHNLHTRGYMEQGGILYWRELYPDVGLIDGSDFRNILIPANIKYQLIDHLLKSVGYRLGFRITSWEEYCIPWQDVGVLLEALVNSESSDPDVRAWVAKAIPFVETALQDRRDLGLAL